MAADTTVKYFTSAMTGLAPVDGATVGILKTQLDKMLITGVNEITLNSLVINGGIATGTTPSAHGYSLLGTTGPVILISGATPVELNGEWRIASVPTSTTFTFVVTGVSDQTATGTILCKRAPLGWENAHVPDAAYAAYRAPAVGSRPRKYFQMEDLQQITTTTMWDTWTSYNVGSGETPSLYINKSSVVSAATRPWILIGDNSSFYLIIDSGSVGAARASKTFCGITSKSFPNDAHNSIVMAGTTQTHTSSTLQSYNLASGRYLSRSWSGAQGWVTWKAYGNAIQPSTMGVGGINSAVNPTENNIIYGRVGVWEEGTIVFRGVLPGAYVPLHVMTTMVDLSVDVGVPVNSTARDLILIKHTSTSNGTCFDITGPWEY